MQTVESQWVSIPVGDQSMSAYVSRPTAGGIAHVVLVGFEMFGLTPYVAGVTDRIAALGYTAVAPDFYHRAGDRIELPETDDGRERGFRLVNELTLDGVADDVRACLGHLGRADAPAAMVGLSVGAHIAFGVATRVPLHALALFYPGWLTTSGTGLSRPTPLLELTSRIVANDTEVLFVVGENDKLYAPQDISLIDDRFGADRLHHETVIYPGAPHGFLCEHRDAFRADAAADAFDRMQALLARALG
ncbi:dienelactone hydrolase family protein [Gordonia sp. TBRC 11910]|uniref:Dienelactone hydrolase family protein n=1 Tax=Gordonia asplenii TaxID=2725283 RepID=A0A848KR32_9ACTN|nr:dienelactone hydrolase family protein [Gordonia asplenii]NMO00712.1 dienelactone hydrolase family protein [Gordonia asplenii]